MTLFFGICFILYFLKLSAGHGFYVYIYIVLQTFCCSTWSLEIPFVSDIATKSINLQVEMVTSKRRKLHK